MVIKNNPFIEEVSTILLCDHNIDYNIFVLHRGAKISIPWFDRPCTFYDAILPLRVLLLRKHNPKIYK